MLGLHNIRRLIREPGDLARFLNHIEEAAILVSPARLPPSAVRDPKDVAVLGTTVAGLADLVVSNDQDLLVLRRFRVIPILESLTALEVPRGR